MNSHAERKEAVRRFKEIKTLRGTFAVKCTATGRIWVGSSRNLDATKNRAWFDLRIGSHQDKSLQAEWNAHGEAAFEYRILETLKDDPHPLALADLLREKKKLWIAQLRAGAYIW